MRSIIVFSLLFMTISASCVSAYWKDENEEVPNIKSLEQQADQSKMLIIRLVQPNGQPSNQQITERVALRWQQLLMNNHISVMPFIPAEDQIIFMFRKGSRASEARDELIKLPECKYTILDTEVRKGAGWREHHGDPTYDDL